MRERLASCWNNTSYRVKCSCLFIGCLIAGLPLFFMGCNKNASTCYSANLHETLAYSESTFYYYATRNSHGYYLKANYYITDENNSTCCRISSANYITNSRAKEALSSFVKIGQHYDLWVPKSKTL
jgi:hypothetical protein